MPSVKIKGKEINGNPVKIGIYFLTNTVLCTVSASGNLSYIYAFVLLLGPYGWE